MDSRKSLSRHQTMPRNWPKKENATMKKQPSKHRGSDFDDFLKEENIYEEVLRCRYQSGYRGTGGRSIGGP